MQGGKFTKYPAEFWKNIQMNAGIMVKGFSAQDGTYTGILGATGDGVTFNPNPTYEDFGSDVDNVPANTKQLKRITAYDPAVSGNFVTMSAALAAKLSGAGAMATGDSTHFIPAQGFVTDVVDDVWIIGDYSDKNTGAANAGYVAIHIIDALNTAGFQWSTTKDGKGQFAFDFHGHYDLTDIDTVPYEIFVKAGTTPT